MSASRNLFLILFLHQKMARKRITRTTRASLRQFHVDAKVARPRKMLLGRHSLKKIWRNLILMSMPFLLMTDTRNTSCDSLTSNGLDVIVVSEMKSMASYDHWQFWSMTIFSNILWIECFLYMCVCGSGWITSLPIQSVTLLKKINIDNIDHSRQGLKCIYIPFFLWQLNWEIELLRLLFVSWHSVNLPHYQLYAPHCYIDLSIGQCGAYSW